MFQIGRLVEYNPTMLTPPAPLKPELRSQWMLKPGVAFLNHGSFGAMPRAVFDAQNHWRERLEAEPIELIGRQMPKLLDEAKMPIAKQFGMNPQDFGFVTNATEGINAILRSLPLKPGDELLTSSHVYGAVKQTMKWVAREAGASYREFDIPIPVQSADEIRDRTLAAVSDRTRLLIIDHVTSPTALVFPVNEIVDACRKKGVDVLVDGAHAPGMLPLNIAEINPAYYAANLHKWICAPRGTAFIWVAPRLQSTVHPTVISHHLDEGFTKEFGWQGTRDFSSWLTVPAALNFMNDLGFEAVMNHNHQLAAWAQQLLAGSWGADFISPVDGSLLGSMATVPLPPPLDQLSENTLIELQQQLYTTFQIENPLMRWNGRNLLRVSCQVYNTPEEYQYVAQTISAIAKQA